MSSSEAGGPGKAAEAAALVLGEGGAQGNARPYRAGSSWSHKTRIAGALPPGPPSPRRARAQTGRCGGGPDPSPPPQ